MWLHFFHCLKMFPCLIWKSKFQFMSGSSIIRLLCQSWVIILQTKYLKLLAHLDVTSFRLLICQMSLHQAQWWECEQCLFLCHAMLHLDFDGQYLPMRLILKYFLLLCFIDSLSHLLIQIRLIINFKRCLLESSRQMVQPILSVHLIDLTEG